MNTSFSVSALPFTVTRGEDIIGAGTMRSTVERTHGLLRLTGDSLVVQWRAVRQTDVIGPEMRSEESIGDLREVRLPLTAAADLSAFDALVGADGLGRTHPAELTLTLRRGDGSVAEAFAADLMLAIAERGLAAGESPRGLL